jgi:hypothetical protein
MGDSEVVTSESGPATVFCDYLNLYFSSLPDAVQTGGYHFYFTCLTCVLTSLARRRVARTVALK